MGVMTLSSDLRPMEIKELLQEAKSDIAAGETRLRAAAEKIAAAEKKGATQRKISGDIGKSLGWINALLKWRERGYKDDTPFGSSSRAARQRRKHVQATEQKNQKPATTSEQARAAAARAQAEQAKAEARKAKADAAKAKADAAKAKAEARKAEAEENTRMHEAFYAAFGGAEKRELHSGARQILVKALGMLGSDQFGERAAAAVVVEKQRAKLGMTWDELIVSAAETETKGKMAA
jgi:hypothetical protein